MAIGKVSSTRNFPNTSDEFSFWLEEGQKVNPTDIVVVENHDGSKTYGLVVRIENYSDSESHLDNYISHNFGKVEAEPLTQKLYVNVARCVVLKNTQNVYMPLVSGCKVDFADVDGVLTALGIKEVEQMAKDLFKPLPAGIIELSNGLKVPAIIDARYLLGPEGAHLNITGIAGLATKTSFIMFLLTTLLQKYKEDMAVIIFNVKQDDLLYIDQPGTITEEDEKLWKILEVEAKPFSNVTYFLPRSKSSPQVAANTFAEELPQNSHIYSYCLSDIKDKISYLFVSVDDPRGTLEALISDIEDDLTHKGGFYSPTHGRLIPVNTFSDLIALFDDFIKNHKQYRHHYLATMGKFLRFLRFFTQTETTGLFVNRRGAQEIYIGHYIWAIRPGSIYVIDIAKLTEDEKAFVIGDITREVYRLFAGEVTYRDLPADMRMEVFGMISESELDHPIRPPEKLIFFIDELNKYAPKGRDMSPILRNILEITERGRSLGVIFLGAEQFASDVHHRVIGNCANKVYGRSDSTELSAEAYRHIPSDLKALITKLEQGKLLLHHPLYRQPIQIHFPRPAYKQPR